MSWQQVSISIRLSNVALDQWLIFHWDCLIHGWQWSLWPCGSCGKGYPEKVDDSQLGPIPNLPIFTGTHRKIWNLSWKTIPKISHIIISWNHIVKHIMDDKIMDNILLMVQNHQLIWINIPFFIGFLKIYLRWLAEFLPSTAAEVRRPVRHLCSRPGTHRGSRGEFGGGDRETKIWWMIRFRM